MRSRAWRARTLAAFLLAAAAGGLAARQGTPSVATTAEAVVRYPGFFQGRPIALVATPIRAGGLWMLDIPGPIALVLQPSIGQPPLRALELRGTILDPHTLPATDSRRAALRAITDVFVPGRTAGKSALLVITAATWLDDAAPAMTLRQVVLHPATWTGRTVTVRGRFHGRNLYDELPAGPPDGTAPSNFVLQSADAAAWVTGLPPAGPGFSFDPALRFDTSRWLAVTGVVRTGAGVVWIEATSVAETQAAPEIIPTPAAPAFRLPKPVVIFTAPVDHDEEVDPATTVRIQFSRDMRETTFGEHVSVQYDGETTKPPPFTIRYRVATRSIELRFGAPLLAGATVTVRLAEGIVALDNSPLEPTEITFRVEKKTTSGVVLRGT